MEKIKRCISALLAVSIMIALAGCGAQAVPAQVEEKEAGTATAQVGFTKEALEEFWAYAGEDHEGVSWDELHQFQYKGKTYYGQLLERGFESSDEVDLEFPIANQKDGFDTAATLNFGELSLEKLDDGNMLMQITIPTEGGSYLETMKEENPDLYAVVVKHKSDSAKVLTFRFEGAVQQTGGCFNGIDVDGSELTLDYMKMENNNCQKYSFKIALDGTDDPTAKLGDMFDDVSGDAWYAAAVENMAASGLVSGYGNGQFGPEDNITIAQFAQILAQYKGVETGAGESGWWAEKALAVCLDNGWLTNRGDAIPENYDTTIRRQEAIAAIQRATELPPEAGNSYTPDDIPDYEDICEKYRNDIVAAYNSGVTTGTDENRTLLPLYTLSRAEVCQLFFNLEQKRQVPIEEFSLSESEHHMKVGENAVLTAELPAGTNDALIVWASSTPSVATVSRGVITAVGAGETLITAAVHGVAATCKVVVTE